MGPTIVDKSQVRNGQMTFADGDWGVSRSATKVDTIKGEIAGAMDRAGLGRSDIYRTDRNDATAFIRGGEEFRAEPVILDDGGTGILGKNFQTPPRPVLKIAVRAASGANHEVAQEIETVLRRNGIDPEQASKTSAAPNEGTVVYSLKRAEKKESIGNVLGRLMAGVLRLNK